MEKQIIKKTESPYGHEIIVNIRLVQFTTEEGVEVVYAPALEVYGYGNNSDEARASFDTSIDEFIHHTNEIGTFEKELERLGWKIQGRKKSRKLQAPIFSDLLINNQNLAEIINNRDFKTQNMPLVMA